MIKKRLMHVTSLGAAAAAIATPTPANARDQSAAVVVYGSAKSLQLDVVASTVAQTLRAASWTVPDFSFTPAERQAIVACTSLDRPWPCVAATARDKSVDRLVVVHVEPDKASEGLVLTGQVLVASDSVPSTDRGWCPKCTNATLVTSAGELANLMLQHSAARQPAADTSPTNAAANQLDASQGLAPAQTEPTSTALSGEPESPSRVVPALVIGAGATAFAIGTYLSFAANSSDSGQQNQYIYSGPGIALAVAGGAAIGAGLYLLLRNAQPTSSPTLTATTSGAVAGWTTTF